MCQLAFVDLTQARSILKVVKHLLGGLSLGSGREVIVFSWVSRWGRPAEILHHSLTAHPAQHGLILRFLEEGSPFSNRLR